MSSSTGKSREDIRNMRIKKMASATTSSSSPSPLPSSSPSPAILNDSTPESSNNKMAISPVSTNNKRKSEQNHSLTDQHTETSKLNNNINDNNNNNNNNKNNTSAVDVPLEKEKKLSNYNSFNSSSPHALSFIPQHLLLPLASPSPVVSVISLFDNEMVSDILSVTLKAPSHNAQNSHNQRIKTFLPDMANDSDSILGLHNVDGIIISRLALPFSASSTSSSPIFYFLNSWKRAYELKNIFEKAKNVLNVNNTQTFNFYPSTIGEMNEIIEKIESICRCIVRYFSVCLSPNDSFNINFPKDKMMDEFIYLLQTDPLNTSSRTLPVQFLSSLVVNLQEEGDEGSLNQFFMPVILRILPVATLNSDVLTLDYVIKSLYALSALTKHGPIASLICIHPNFIPDGCFNGRDFQRRSIIGPLLSIMANGRDSVFAGVRESRDPEDLLSSVRDSYHGYQSACENLFLNLIKNKDTREKLVNWGSAVCRYNIHKRKMQHDPNTCSTEPFLFNVFTLFLKLSLPIVDPAIYARRYLGKSSSERASVHIESYEKIALDIFLSDSKGLVDFDNQTRLDASQTDINLIRTSKPTPPTFSFNTQCFILTCELFHIGLQPLLKLYTHFMQQYSQVHHQIQSGIVSSSDPHIIKTLDFMAADIFALRVHIHDINLIHNTALFANWTCSWLVHVVTRSDGPMISLKGPENENSQRNMSGLIPEYIVEDVVTWFTFLGRFLNSHLVTMCNSSTSENSTTAGIFSMMITLGAGQFALKNPHLRGKFPECLQLLIPQDKTMTESHLFNVQPLFVNDLVRVLLSLYVDIEFGPHMFYAKFSARFQIAELISFLWQSPIHKNRLVQLSSQKSFFIPFLNALANDVVYLLDESLKYLSTIKQNQDLLRDSARFNSMPLSEQDRIRQAHSQNEGICTSMMQLANASVNMLSFLTSEIVEPFVCGEMQDRIATMITYYMEKLVGPAISELKVENKEKYHFKPRLLLKDMIVTLLHLSNHEEFVKAIASDRRSYSPQMFNKTAEILTRRVILTDRQLNQFKALAVKTERLCYELEDEDEILGEVPEEYLDAIIGSRMMDPVQLPTSKVIVDRSTIQRHLMNSRTDPMNRQPLTEEELIPQNELKEKIEKWVEERKNIWRANKKAEAEEIANKKAQANTDDKSISQPNTTNNNDVLTNNNDNTNNTGSVPTEFLNAMQLAALNQINISEPINGSSNNRKNTNESGTGDNFD